jgi:sec-independent protein translocase protein TatC
MTENSWLPHLIELRTRLLRSAGFFVVLFVLFFYFSNGLFAFLASPMLKLLPGKLLATNVASPLIIPLQLALYAALTCSVPFFFYQVWRFVTPGLYKTEKRTLPVLVTGSILLFVLGMMFCFYLVLPFLFSFFYQAVPGYVQFSPDIGSYLSFSLGLLFSFGLCFQIPIVIVFLVHYNLVSLKRLKAFRPYLIVSAFIVGMLLTPPDVLSQILLAVPICLLFEAGLLVASKLLNAKNKPAVTA